MTDRIGVALGSLAMGAAAGAALITGGLAAFRTQLTASLPLIVFAGIVTAGGTAWMEADPIDDPWRRAVTATLAVFAALMLTLVAAPVDIIGGQGGLLVYAVTLAAGAIAARRVARRARQHEQ